MLPVLANATLSVEDWLKSKFYPHLSENRVEVNNANKQLRISARVQPSLSAVDLMFFKPQSNTFFRNLPLSQTANVVFPLSAKSSLTERLVDNTISDGFARGFSIFLKDLMWLFKLVFLKLSSHLPVGKEQHHDFRQSTIQCTN